MASDIALAKMYNQTTGANVTHLDVRKWGFLETEIIRSSMSLLTDEELTPIGARGKAHGNNTTSNQGSV